MIITYCDTVSLIISEIQKEKKTERKVVPSSVKESFGRCNCLIKMKIPFSGHGDSKAERRE